jgi:hypothetical protein
MQVRQFSVPLVWCSMPRACSSIAVSAWPHHSAAFTMDAAGTPVIRAVYSGV